MRFVALALVVALLGCSSWTPGAQSGPQYGDDSGVPGGPDGAAGCPCEDAGPDYIGPDAADEPDAGTDVSEGGGGGEDATADVSEVGDEIPSDASDASDEADADSSAPPIVCVCISVHDMSCGVDGGPADLTSCGTNLCSEDAGPNGANCIGGTSGDQ